MANEDIIQQLQSQAQQLLNQADKMKSESNQIEISAEDPNAKGNWMYTITKMTILIMFVIFALIGILGSVGIFPNFKMNDYMNFLEKFAWIWGPLVISIAGGRSLKKISQAISTRNNNQQGQQ
jgi:hypothetical protein